MSKTQKKMNVIIGLGKTGLSCVRYCLRERMPFAVTDSRKNPPGLDELKEIAPKAKTAFGGLSNKLIKNASQLIISPGVSIHDSAIEEAIQEGIPFVGDIELFVQKINVPIVAITGSNAKSTVTVLVGEMAKADGKNVVVAGNIGTPVLDKLSKKATELYVLELSSFQLETTHSLKAKVATILNISEDHMDRYKNMDEYIAAKKIIFNDCESAVVNRADSRLNPQIKNMISFGLDAPDKDQYGLIQSRKGVFLARGDKPLLNVEAMKIRGRHNIENALASLALGESVGLSMDAMLLALKQFRGLAHRCQFVCERDGVAWYNDSKGTNVGATVAAIEGLAPKEKGKIVLIAGGIGKGADFTPLRMPIKKSVRKVILIGQASKQLKTILKDDTEIEVAYSLEEAVKLSDLAANRGDVVLLSPACASFDMFNNYEHRGNEFMKLVNMIDELE